MLSNNCVQKKLCLIRTTNSHYIIPPYGLLCLASYIRNKSKKFDWDIKIIDFKCDGLTCESFRNELDKFNPDVIGFSSLPTEYSTFKELCLIVKKNMPDKLLIAGGPLPTNDYEIILKKKLVDVVVIGEGEIPALELLESNCDKNNIPANIKGIAYFNNGELIKTKKQDWIEDLDCLPVPAWDLINIKNYRKFANWNGPLMKKDHAPIMTSRGCIFQCVYCQKYFGNSVRMYSVKRVVAEISFLYYEYGIREFHIIDDFFNFDLERVKALCREIINKKLKIKMAFPNAIRADRMDIETLDYLKRAGTYKINYAIESTSPRIQKKIKKNLNLEKTGLIIEETSKRGIITFGFFMLGFPSETEDEIRNTISFAVNSKLDTAMFFKVSLFKNTELTTMVHNKQFHYIDDRVEEIRDVYTSDKLNYSDIDLDLLNSLFKDAYKKFYLKPSRIWRIIRKYRKLDAVINIFLILIKLPTLYRA